MKKLSLIIFLIFFLSLIILGNLAFAQRSLEVDYPEFGGQKAIPYLPNYVKYIYYAVIGISGVVALVVLIGAGTNYLMSAGNPEKMKNARDEIKAAILGLIILFASYLIVNIINPEIAILRLSPIESFLPEMVSGVYLCTNDVRVQEAWNKNIALNATEEDDYQTLIKLKEELIKLLNEINESCITGVTSSFKVRTLEKPISHIYTVPGKGKEGTKHYGAILYSQENHQGTRQIVFPPPKLPGRVLEPLEVRVIKMNNVGSIHTFYLRPLSIFWGVELYQHENYNRDYEAMPATFTSENAAGQMNGYHGRFDLLFPPQSIKIWGSAIVLLSSSNDIGKYAVFMPGEEDPYLLDNEEITEQKCTGLIWRECETIPVADSLTIVLGMIYY